MKIQNKIIPNKIVKESRLLSLYIPDIENQNHDLQNELEEYLIENNIDIECFDIFSQDGYIDLLHHYQDEEKMDNFIKLFEILYMKHSFFHYVKPAIYPQMNFLKKNHYLHGIYYFFFSFTNVLTYQFVLDSVDKDLSVEWFYHICYHHYIHTITLPIINKIIKYNRFDLFRIIFSNEIRFETSLYIDFDYKILNYLIFEKKYQYIQLLLQNNIVPDYLSFICGI